MTIEIHRPELESLIEQRLKSGAYLNIEDLLMHALRIGPDLESNEGQTGASIVAAMQACPLKEIDIEPERYPMPVRDVIF